MIDPIEWTRRFIDIPSVTGDEEAMTASAASLLRAIGFDVRLQPVAAHRDNVIATLDSPRVLLCTHLDTVPPFIPAREDADTIYGRGACDTKGILAAMAAAAERLVADGVRDVGLLLVVGEETDSIGAKTANAELDLGPVRYTIVGEPTESQFARAQKGGFKFTLRVQGRAAHSGYPERGQSAVLELMRLLAIVRDTDWGHDSELGAATANIGTVRGGLRANIVPERAEAEVFVRVVDSADAVRGRIAAIAAVADLPLEWSEDTANDPQRLLVPDGEPSTVVAFNTDVPHLSRFGQRLLVGPGSILDAHAPHEQIRKRDIVAAVDLYVHTVQRLRGR